MTNNQELIMDKLEEMLKDKNATCSLNRTFCEEVVNTFDKNIRPNVIEKLLNKCIADPKDNVTNATETLNIVSLVLKKVIAGEITKPDLLPSMLKIVNLLKTAIYSCSSEDIKDLYFTVLCSYPDEIYINLEEDHYPEVLELFNLYIPQGQKLIQPIILLNKYMKLLSPDKRLKFVKEGINIWFLKLIPSVMLWSTLPNFNIETSLDTLEMVSNELLHIDYTDNQNWQCVIQSTIRSEKYPAIMKKLLEKGSDYWPRMWVIFIKVLKSQLTRKINNEVSPINSMLLPVVEAALKMDVVNRCRAFHCWNVLIDNLASETNENTIHKRMKCLLTPLYSNNAKVEDTVLAKLGSWWHLICGFHSKLNNFAEIVLVPFLNFCFGKSNVDNTSSFVPGLLTNKTKEKCIQAFVNILGHYNCDGCVSLPNHDIAIINAMCLMDNWKDLMHGLSVSMKIAADSPSQLRKPLKCAWTSFIQIICEAPDTNGRDLIDKLLSILENLIQNCKIEILYDMIIDDYILTIIGGDEKIIQFLKRNEEMQKNLIERVVLKMLNPILEPMYKQCGMIEALKKLQPFVKILINQSFHIEALLKINPINYNSLVLWTAVASYICENECDITPQVLCNLLLWPLQHLDLLTNVETATSQWLDMLDILHTKDTSLTENIKAEILRICNDSEKDNSVNRLFLLNVSVVLLKQKISKHPGVDYQNEVDLVHHFTSKIQNLNHLVFSTLLDLLPSIFKRLTEDVNLNIAKKVFSLLKIVFSLILPEFKKSAQIDNCLLLKVECFLKAIKNFLKLKAYANLNQLVYTELIDCAPYFGQQQSLNVTIVATLQIILTGMDKDNPSVSIIKNIIHTLKNGTDTANHDNFITPCKSNIKNAKKGGPNITTTVLENGEKFAVVDSGWKFNPKKLTDHQRERLQRKREDIPALYQDLSQDLSLELKLSTWKTDSQDTTTTSTTNSKSNDDVSVAIKSMPNTDVVPNIMKNILHKNNEKNNTSSKSREENHKIVQTPTNRVKTDKIALKDRVFRSVRNLMEKSNVQNDEKNTQLMATDITKTPNQSRIKPNEIILNSAPSEMDKQRPSRSKRAPKKFNEMQVFPLNKRSHSIGSRESRKSKSFEEKVTEICGNENEIDDIIPRNVPEHQDHPTNLVPNFPGNDLVKVPESESVLNVDLQGTTGQDLQEKVELSQIDVDKLSESVLTNVEENVNKCNDKLQHKKTNETSMEIPVKRKLGKRKSCIERELAIDMVEGHPLLTVQSEKRATRKKISESSITSKKRRFSIDVNNSIKTRKNRAGKKIKIPDKAVIDTTETQVIESVCNSQDGDSQLSGSQDFIESSQDSTISVISSKSTRSVKRVPVDNTVHKTVPSNTIIEQTDNANIFNVDKVSDSEIINSENKDENYFNYDTVAENIEMNLTENMETEPVESTLSITSSKSTKILSVVALENELTFPNSANQEELIPCINAEIFIIDKKSHDTDILNCDNNDDSKFPYINTAASNIQIDSTENFNTQPIENSGNEKVIVIDDEPVKLFEIMTSNTLLQKDTQDITEADTETLDTKDISIILNHQDNTPDKQKQINCGTYENFVETIAVNGSATQAQDDITKSVTESLPSATENEDESSLKLSVGEKEKRKQDFLDSTLEISPIKTLSPVRDNKSPSPDMSGDFVVITLSSPVQSNGEPYDKCDSPEIFTEEKVSPDKRDQSPARDEALPSPRSLSLKKNKPQVRSGGRAAQMLGLCVPAPDRLQTITSSEKSLESDETKKCSKLNSSARRNLRILYNTSNENIESPDENEKLENFLKFQRTLPDVDCNPAVPILKRKLADIMDESTVSPVSKRKRVSFHDPPVSTTICVKKYIEPCNVRSPQNSGTKRQERQLRSQTSVKLKSQKRLDTVLDTALTKAVESFSEDNVTPSINDTEISSLEPTPILEIVKNCELNDVDPICTDLIDCEDPIDNIAADLSSPAMRPLLVKEFAGKVETVGDLAKMSELEVNRLCIKAPKVQVTKKVLTQYAKKIKDVANVITPTIEALSESTEVESSVVDRVVDVEMQTDCVSLREANSQTELSSSQTVTVATMNANSQTDESGSTPNADLLISWLERPDLCEGLNDNLTKKRLQSALMHAYLNFGTHIGSGELNHFIDRLLNVSSQNGRTDNQRLSRYTDFLHQSFSSNDLARLCVDIMRKLHDI